MVSIMYSNIGLKHANGVFTILGSLKPITETKCFVSDLDLYLELNN